MRKARMQNLQLKRLRYQAGFKTQADLAAALDVNPRTYASWEREEVGLSLKEARRLADILECSLDELAGRTGCPARFADKRQQELNELYVQLDDVRKQFVLEAMRGLSAAHTHKRD